MKISTRARYAIRSAMCLASKYGQGPVSLKRVSKNQDISAKYLENIMRLLVKEGIVQSVKGKCGGFLLSKPPEKISVYDIIKITHGPVFPLRCIEYPESCKRMKTCAPRDMWIGLNKVMIKYLSEISISTLTKNQKSKYISLGKTPPCL